MDLKKLHASSARFLSTGFYKYHMFLMCVLADRNFEHLKTKIAKRTTIRRAATECQKNIPLKSSLRLLGVRISVLENFTGPRVVQPYQPELFETSLANKAVTKCKFKLSHRTVDTLGKLIVSPVPSRCRSLVSIAARRAPWIIEHDQGIPESSKMDQVMRMKDVVKRIGLCRATIYSMISRGEFPRPIRIGERATGWRESELEAWLAKRSAATEQAARPFPKGH
ncbi:transcriptional regulator, AlpA family [Paraburkholderia susongensis]|uniref:Transcriptional regulator, AlpA family n=2 Tax=Paraburkholderia susongensis TaxID=1515439 RepID=A0A1X7M5P7_9BURK|nr:transcriptional regulator, AlpA family [Paraburkholderia susongensis]